MCNTNKFEQNWHAIAVSVYLPSNVVVVVSWLIEVSFDKFNDSMDFVRVI